MKIRHCKWCPAYSSSATALRTQESCYPDNHNLSGVYVCVAKFSIAYCRWFFALFIQNKTSSSLDPPVFPHYLWHKTSPITYGRLLLTKFEKTSRFFLALLVFNFIWASRCNFCVKAKRLNFRNWQFLLDPTVHRRTSSEVALAPILLSYNSKQR